MLALVVLSEHKASCVHIEERPTSVKLLNMRHAEFGSIRTV